MTAAADPLPARGRYKAGLLGPLSAEAVDLRIALRSIEGSGHRLSDDVVALFLSHGWTAHAVDQVHWLATEAIAHRGALHAQFAGRARPSGQDPGSDRLWTDLARRYAVGRLLEGAWELSMDRRPVPLHDVSVTLTWLAVAAGAPDTLAGQVATDPQWLRATATDWKKARPIHGACLAAAAGLGPSEAAEATGPAPTLPETVKQRWRALAALRGWWIPTQQDLARLWSTPTCLGRAAR